MEISTTRRRTSNEAGIKGDGSRRTSRSKSPIPTTGNCNSRTRSPGPNNTKQRQSRSRSPARTRSSGSNASSANSSISFFGSMTEVLEDYMGFGHFDNAAFEEQVKHCIPSEFMLLASQDDYTQAQEDWFAMENYNLPVSKSAKNINAGSVATCALLQLMYENPNRLVASSCQGKPLSCLEVLQEIKKRVKQHSKLEAKPTISSSRPLGPPRLNRKHADFYVVPPGYTGKRHALLIGVKVGEGPVLKGSHNDITNMSDFLRLNCGFKAADITVLKDDGIHKEPNKKNILAEFSRICLTAKAKDVVFIQFSGHGGRIGNNLYICPSDYKKGPIMDETILRDLIKAMPANVYTTMLVDCCYSGTVGDLPYVLKSIQPGAREEIESYFDTNTRAEMITKERDEGRKYQEFKQARAERRSAWRLGPAKIMYDAAGAVVNAGSMTVQYAADGALMVGTGMAHGVYAVGTAGAEAATAAAASVYNVGAAGATGMYNAAGEAVFATGNAVTTTLRRSGTGAVSVAEVATSVTRAASPFRRSATQPDKSSNLSEVEDFEEAARKEAVERSRREAAEARASRGGGAPSCLRSSENSHVARSRRAPVRRCLSLPKKTTSSGADQSKRSSLDGKKGLARGLSPMRHSNTADQTKRGSLDSKKGLARGLSPIRQSNTSSKVNAPIRRTCTTDTAQSTGVFSAFSNVAVSAANSMTSVASLAATSAACVANSAASAASTGAGLRRTVTSAGEAASSTGAGLRRTVTSAGEAANSTGAGLRRTFTAPARNLSPVRTTRAKSPMRGTSPVRGLSPRRTKSKEEKAAEDAEENARREAVERSRKEAEEARASARR